MVLKEGVLLCEKKCSASASASDDFWGVGVEGLWRGI